MENMLFEYDDYWVEGTNKPISMHSIHTYPAKFPPYMVEKAFSYAISEGVKINTVADIFCGCGTTALEAKLYNYDFWGCDINPVATLITSTKIAEYDIQTIVNTYNAITATCLQLNQNENPYLGAPERLKYWFSQKQYNSLFRLLSAIDSTIPDTEKALRDAFHCLFSSILKRSSKWLQKSIKPQIDPKKKEIDVMKLFEKQYKSFIKAIKEINKHNLGPNQSVIKTENFLLCSDKPQIDLLITSPPYVTSYEYADLHQLSSLWLGYTDDYRKLRKGTIGSGYDYEDCKIEKLKLNDTADKIIKDLVAAGSQKSKMIPVARYYDEMQKMINKCYGLLSDGGMSVYVIGDSEIGGVKLCNAKHLVESMIEEGFTDVKISKRVVSKGICVPYRNSKGQFTNDKETENKVYNEEYIISGRK